MDIRITIIALTFLEVIASARNIYFQCPFDDIVLAYPHPESCKKYYRCTFGNVEELTCPYTLYFDAESRICTYPDSVRCVEGTEVEKWHRPICANDGRVKMVPHQMICDKYYLCLGSSAVEKRCDEGFLFDMDTSKCNYAEKTRCNLDPWCPEFDQIQDLKYFRDPEDCSRYSVCYNREFYQQQCAEGLYFNVEMQECTYPSRSNCKINGVNCTFGSKDHPHPSKCNSYYECDGNIPVYRECEDGYFFSEQEALCVPDNGECSIPSEKSSSDISNNVN